MTSKWSRIHDLSSLVATSLRALCLTVSTDDCEYDIVFLLTPHKGDHLSAELAYAGSLLQGCSQRRNLKTFYLLAVT